MNKQTYTILRYVKKTHTPRWIDVLNHFDPERKANQTERLLRAALAMGFIRTLGRAEPPDCQIKLTPIGEYELLDFTSLNTNWYLNEIRAWITLAIAFAALIVSVIALCN